jgi:hypothetical protein
MIIWAGQRWSCDTRDLPPCACCALPVRPDEREMATAGRSTTQRVGVLAGRERRPCHQESARCRSRSRRTDRSSGATRAIRYIQLPVGRLGRATEARRHRPCRASTWSASKQLTRGRDPSAEASPADQGGPPRVRRTTADHSAADRDALTGRGTRPQPPETGHRPSVHGV